MTKREVQTVAKKAAAVRAAFGGLAIASPGPASRLLGFPAGEDNSTARLMGRFFGVRELALAALVWGAPMRRRSLRRVFLLNAAVDGGDAAVLAATLRNRSDTTHRAAAAMTGFAVLGCGLWLYLANEL